MTDRDLLALAAECSRLARAPHSGFRVGVALLVRMPGTERTLIGCNVEKETYAQPVCPEAIALEAALAGLDRAAGEDEAAIVRVALHYPDVQNHGTHTADAASAHNDLPCAACARWLHAMAPEVHVLTNLHPVARPVSELPRPA